VPGTMGLWRAESRILTGTGTSSLSLGARPSHQCKAGPGPGNFFKLKCLTKFHHWTGQANRKNALEQVDGVIVNDGPLLRNIALSQEQANR
jgi:hypothetical protein